MFEDNALERDEPALEKLESPQSVLPALAPSTPLLIDRKIKTIQAARLE